MGFKGLRNLIKQDIAMDLGTANTLIYLQGEGIVLNEPTVIAFEDSKNSIQVGQRAKEYLGRTPAGIRVVRPMKDGVIEDFDAVSTFIKTILARARERKGILSPILVICVPSQITQVEKRAVIEAARQAGGKRIYLVEETMAAAVGAGLAVMDKRPSMVVDIGGGTTECAVISNMAYDHCESIRVAGDEMDDAIANWLKKQMGIIVGPSSAERLKWEIGSATGLANGRELSAIIAGKDAVTGAPVRVTISSVELARSLTEPIKAIGILVTEVFNALGPEIQAAIQEDGVTLTGGGSLLNGMAEFLEEETGLRYTLSEDPLTTVVRGAGKTIEDFGKFEPIFIG